MKEKRFNVRGSISTTLYFVKMHVLCLCLVNFPLLQKHFLSARVVFVLCNQKNDTCVESSFPAQLWYEWCVFSMLHTAHLCVNV